MPNYVDQGGAAAVSTSTIPAYPTTVLAGQGLVLTVFADASGIGTPSDGGWTDLTGGVVTSGSMNLRQWGKIAVGGETGSVTVNITSGTKGVAHIARYQVTTGGNSLTFQDTVGADTTSGTGYSASGSSWTSVTTTDIIGASTCAVVTSGTFSANATSPTLTQSGATVTSTAQFAGRTGTNTLYYGHVTGPVTSGGTGAPTLAATLVGASGTGETGFVLIREVAPSLIPRLRVARRIAVHRSRSY
jgi:hypothetical protein